MKEVYFHFSDTKSKANTYEVIDTNYLTYNWQSYQAFLF